MTREIIENYGFRVETKDHDSALAFTGGLDDWLRQQAAAGCWLLAHAADGVIWGWANADELHTAHEVAPSVSPPLRLETLQQLRLFNGAYEVKLWPAVNGWQAMRVTDVTAPNAAGAIDEDQLLWGTYAEPLDGGFIRLEDGAQGLVHVVPPFAGSEHLSGRLGLLTDKEPPRRVCLKVRHYVTENELGVNAITLSRLVELGVYDA